MTFPSAGATSAGIERRTTPLPIGHDYYYTLLSFIADWMTSVATAARAVFLHVSRQKAVIKRPSPRGSSVRA